MAPDPASSPEAGPDAPVVLILGPDRQAISGVSTHVNLLFQSALSRQFRLLHFQVGSEGRNEGRLGRLWRFISSPFSLALRLYLARVDLLHINTSLNPRAFWRDLGYLIVARLMGVRVLYQIHGGSVRHFPAGRRLRQQALKFALRLPSTVVVLSSGELAACRQLVPGQSIRLLPNGIDPQAFAPRGRREGLQNRDIRLLYIGRLARDKGLFEALHALRLARLQGAAVQLLIAGGGPDEAALRHAVSDLHLESDVRFVGPVFGEAKQALLAAADVLLLPSYSEGLPYALLECMAAGMPAIATPVGAIPDVLIDGCHGLLVPPRDIHAIARAIVRLAGDRQAIASMGDACRERIGSHYSLTRLAQDFAAVYAEPHPLPGQGLIQPD